MHKFIIYILIIQISFLFVACSTPKESENLQDTTLINGVSDTENRETPINPDKLLPDEFVSLPPENSYEITESVPQQDRSLTSSVEAVSSSSDPIIYNEDNCVDTQVDVDDYNEPSSQTEVSQGKKKLSEKKVEYIEQLKKSLDPNYYGSIESSSLTNTIDVYTTIDEEKMRQIIEEICPNPYFPDIQLQFYHCEYPTMFFDEAEKNLLSCDLVRENQDKIISITRDSGIKGIDIMLVEEIPELQEWIDNSAYHDIIHILYPKTNPN